MSRVVVIELVLPDDLALFRLPPGVHARLQALLDRQDGGVSLTEAERREAEGLVDLAELLTFLRLRSEREIHTASHEQGEDREWEQRAAEEFGRGYDGTDAIYDQRSTE